MLMGRFQALVTHPDAKKGGHARRFAGRGANPSPHENAPPGTEVPGRASLSRLDERRYGCDPCGWS